MYHYKTKRLAKLLLAGMAIVSAAYSASADSPDGYYSHHLVSCGLYSGHRSDLSDTQNNTADSMYIAGWLSAYNYLTPNTYDILQDKELGTALNWLDGYCKDHPDSNLEKAIAAFTQASYAKRLTSNHNANE